MLTIMKMITIMMVVIGGTNSWLNCTLEPVYTGITALLNTTPYGVNISAILDARYLRTSHDELMLAN